jgi:GNAT superfamily N-acetyltransferase
VKECAAVSDADLVGRVDFAREGDISAFMALASEVEELFGAPMSTDPLFAATVLKNIRRRTALVVRERDEPGTALIGAVLWSPSSRQIGWLVVARAWRGKGVGTMLVNEVVSAAGAGPLRVVTFASGSEEMEQTRQFYAKLGFRRMTSPNGDGRLNRQTLVRE